MKRPRLSAAALVVLAASVALAATVLAQTAPAKPSGATVQTTGIVLHKLPVRVECPVAQVTVGVETPAQLPAPWWDTPFAMTLSGTSLTTVGGKPGIACNYAGSGRDWVISRALEPDFASCTPQGHSFSCVPK